MNAKEQKDFVRELTETIATNILNKIDDGKIPETWDGDELRQLIFDNMWIVKMDRKRFAEYCNAVLINDL